MRRCIILSLLVLIPTSAPAIFFEYMHLSDSEQREVNGPRRLDSEYQSDILAYDMPIQWQYNWHKERQAFQYSAGSLGPKRFSTRGRLRLRENISEDFFFQMAFVDYADFEMDRRAFVFEFGYQFKRWLSLNVYGQPATLKREDDVGLATEILFSEHNHLRIFHTWVDFTHNKRNEDHDYYTHEPTSIGAVWRWWSEPDKEEVLELGLRHDSRTTRIYPETSQIYSFSGSYLTFKHRKKMSENFDYLNIHLEASQGYEADTLNTDSSVERWDTRRMSFLLQHQNDHQLISMYGIKKVHIHWESAQGSVIHNSLLPHLWAPIYRSQSGGINHQWLAGLETTWHRGRGPVALRGINDFDNRFEHRLNFRYQLAAFERAELTVLLSFDLDNFESSPWEGGNMMYRMNF